MINKIEKDALESLNFGYKYLNLVSRFYSNVAESNWIYCKKDVLSIFRDIDLDVKYVSGGAYISVQFCNFSVYIYYYHLGNLCHLNIKYALNFIKYDEKLAEKLNKKCLNLEDKAFLRNIYIYVL